MLSVVSLINIIFNVNTIEFDAYELVILNTICLSIYFAFSLTTRTLLDLFFPSSNQKKKIHYFLDQFTCIPLML